MTVLHNERDSSSSSISFSSSAGPSTSHTSFTMDTARMHSPRRRIRFAPLPDPRRAVVVTDDGHELPIKDDTHFPAATSLAVLQNHNLTSQTQKQAVTSCSDPDPPPEQSTSASATSPALSSPSDSQHSSSNTARQYSRPFTVNMLRPFKRPPSPSKSKTRKPKSFSITTEEILTLGTINLFRSSSISSDQDNSKENNDPSSSSSSPFNSLVGGWGLSKRTSTTPSYSNNAQTENEILGSNPPLARSQSVQESADHKKNRSSITTFFSSAPGVASLVDLRPKTNSQRAKSNTIRSKPATSSSSASGSTITNGKSATLTRTSVLPATQRTARHKGARMLNGRIYGAKDNNRKENPFANARDDEPEFVEWGYGGMGSVKGAKSAGVVGNAPGAVNWERLLGGSEVSANTGWTVPGGGRGGAGARVKKGDIEREGPREKRSGQGRVGEGAEDSEDDDGSGLAWVRKRKRMREEKEKEKRMKENEQAHEKTLTSDSVPSSPSAVRITDSATQATIKASVHNRDQPGSREGDLSGADEHGHEYTQLTESLNVNGHVMKAISVPMPGRQTSQHKRSSSRGMVEGAESGTTVATIHDHDYKKLEDVFQQDPEARAAGSESSSSSSSVSESSEEESISDGEDTSEDDQDEDERRRTAIGAGVEKVTASFRHRG